MSNKYMYVCLILVLKVYCEIYVIIIEFQLRCYWYLYKGEKKVNIPTLKNPKKIASNLEKAPSQN